MKQKSKRREIPGELESKKLKGGEELILVSSKKPGERDGYQLVLLVGEARVNFVGDPFQYDPVTIEGKYDEIKTIENFWIEKDDLTPEYSLGSDEDLNGDTGRFSLGSDDTSFYGPSDSSYLEPLD